MIADRHGIAPRTQAWATWILALSSWMLAVGMTVWKVGPEGTVQSRYFAIGLLLMALYTVTLAPLLWLILRRKPIFRVPPRIHALQIGLYLSGVGGIPVLAAVGALVGWW